MSELSQGFFIIINSQELKVPLMPCEIGKIKGKVSGLEVRKRINQGDQPQF